MEIIIPSKNIFSVKNNVINDNVVDNVQVEVQNVSLVSELDKIFYQQNLWDGSTTSLPTTTIIDKKIKDVASKVDNALIASGIIYEYTCLKDVKISIPRTRTETTEDVIKKAQINLQSNLKFYEGNGFYYPKTEQNDAYFEGSAGQELGSLNLTSKDLFDRRKVFEAEVPLTQLNVISDANSQHSATVYSFSKSELRIDAPIKAKTASGQPLAVENHLDLTLIPQVLIKETPSEFVLEFDEIVTQATIWVVTATSLLSGRVGCPVSKIVYNCSYLNISAIGETLGISLKDTTKTFGIGNKAFTLSGNELMQDSTTINGKNVAEHLADQVLEKYRNGKETAVLRCSIGDYYKADGTVNDNMTFHISDRVIPLTRNALGKDVPMSIIHNKYPKVFEVVGVKPYYDGACWQDITIQADNDTMGYMVSGNWEFSYSIALPNSTIYQKINFTSNGTKYNAILCTPSEIIYYNDFDKIFAYKKFSGWLNDGLRKIDFGEQQFVSESFDYFITENQLLLVPTPTIYIDNDILYIQDNTGLAEKFDIYLNDELYVEISKPNSTFDLSQLAAGNYKITVVAKAYNYFDSLPSNAVNYIVIPQIPTPTISLDGNTLKIIDPSNIATSFDILVDGRSEATTTKKSYYLIDLDKGEGVWNISVIAKADGYIDSATSQELVWNAPDHFRGYVLTPCGENETAKATAYKHNDGKYYGILHIKSLVPTDPINNITVDIGDDTDYYNTFTFDVYASRSAKEPLKSILFMDDYVFTAELDLSLYVLGEVYIIVTYMDNNQGYIPPLYTDDGLPVISVTLQSEAEL